MAALGQLRIAPSGKITGLDMTAALSIAAARHYDGVSVSELLQEAEAVFVPLLNEPDTGDHG